MSFLDCFHDTLNVALCQNSALLIAGDNELIYQIESSFFIARVNSRLRTNERSEISGHYFFGHQD